MVNQALTLQRNLTVEVVAVAANITAAPAHNNTNGTLAHAPATQRFALAEAPPASVTNVSGWRWDPMTQPGVRNENSGAGGTVWFIFLWLRDADGALLSRNACALNNAPFKGPKGPVTSACGGWRWVHLQYKHQDETSDVGGTTQIFSLWLCRANGALQSCNACALCGGSLFQSAEVD